MFPVLTPLAVDPGNPFPFISNLSTSLRRHPPPPGPPREPFRPCESPRGAAARGSASATAPDASPTRFVSLHELIRHNLDDLFPDMAIVDVMRFRVTRNADIERDEEEAEDLLELVEEELRQRRFANVVRLEVAARNANPWILEFLIRELRDHRRTTSTRWPAELDYDDLRPIADLNVPPLRYEPWTPVVPPPLADEDGDIFKVIREGDVLVHMPVRKLRRQRRALHQGRRRRPEGAGDQDDALPHRRGQPVHPDAHPRRRGAQAGRLPRRAQGPLRRGAQHPASPPRWKRPASTSSTAWSGSRRTPRRRWSSARTPTASAATPTSAPATTTPAPPASTPTWACFTCDPAITQDLVELFHYLTGRSLKRDYQKLLVAPVNMQPRFLEMIDREVDTPPRRPAARIIAKMNSLEERKVCRALYRGSRRRACRST